MDGGVIFQFMAKAKEPLPDNIIDFSDDHLKFEEEAKKIENGKLFLLEFFATWSNPSRRLNALLPTLAKENPEIKFYRVDIDKNKEFSDHMGMKSNIPYIIFYKNREGVLTEVDKLQGFDQAKLKSKIESNKV